MSQRVAGGVGTVLRWVEVSRFQTKIHGQVSMIQHCTGKDPSNRDTELCLSRSAMPQAWSCSDPPRWGTPTSQDGLHTPEQVGFTLLSESSALGGVRPGVDK